MLHLSLPGPGRENSMKGSITSRGENTWLIRYYLPGTKKQIAVTFKGNYEDAELELARLLRKAKTGFVTEPEKITVGELLDRWLEIKKDKVEDTSWIKYIQNAKIWKKAGLEFIPLQKLIAIDIERALIRIPGNGKTKDLAYTVLKSTLKKAVQWKLIPHNPMDAVERPRVDKKEQQVLVEDEAARFLQAAKDNRWYALFYLALKTGTRLGELLALEWRHVDLERAEIHIVQTLVTVKGKKKLHPPKTKRSNRKIILDNATVALLKQHKKQRTEDAVRLGYGKVSWVFWVDKTGYPPTQSTILYHIHRLTKKAKVPDLHPHCLRHTHATFLLRQGVHMKIVAERLGHETLTMTDMYSHVLPDSQQEAVKAMKNLDF